MQRNTRRGFTLIELLVVIGIISVLTALLLPAVQRARDAARRTECRNNLHQMGIGLHNYHEAHLAFPIGANHSFTHGMTYSQDLGQSFFVSILPFVEQGNLYNSLDQDAPGGVGNTANPLNTNGPQFDGITLKIFECPSSPMRRLTTQQANSPHGVIMPNYVGIAGASTTAKNPNPLAEATYYGIMASSGVLVPNRSVKIAEITDGTTNTMMVAEQSAYSRDRSGKQVDLRSSNSHGGWVGTTGRGVPGEGTWFCTYYQSWNITTVRYPINFKDATNITSAGGGLSPLNGSNRPIQSAHDGGAHILLADGSVRFVQENIDYTTLTNLANRNDGEIVGPF
jgi:prepilin-type N-terminal cleavage/methylation domain-containing protein/prepilin-type processing-associated H-X9-DG protein